MQKKKILFVVEAFGGGIFTYVADLVNELSEYYDFTIAYALRSQTPEDFKSYYKDNVNFVEVKHFQRAIQPIYDLKALFEIKNIAKEVDPDIIHLHSSKAGVLGRVAFGFKSKPLFYTPHGYSFLMQEMSVVKRKLYFLIEKVMTFNKCITISCSEGEHNETLRLTKRAKYVNNGIDIEKLDKQLNVVSSKSNNKSFIVFTIGRICYQKNPTLFNEIALKMSDVDFLWIGDGERREDLFSDNIKDNPSPSQPVETKVVTISGSFVSPYAEVGQNSRSAQPEFSYSDYTNYFVKATATYVTGEVDGTVNATNKTFSIPLSK